ncbi:MAG: hypothetical protein ACJA0V_001593 [Planctomycetota bacterium]
MGPNEVRWYEAVTPMTPGNPGPRLSLPAIKGYDPGADVMSEHSSKDSAFPHWVAFGSLVFVLAMFFSNTVPALRERQGLSELKTQLVILQQQLETAIEQTARQARLGSSSQGSSRLGSATNSGEEPDGNFDLQSLLVAIDEHNLTPLELWQQYGGSSKGEEDQQPK